MAGDRFEGRTDREVTDMDLTEVKEWISTQHHLPQNIPDDLLKMFLHSCYSDPESSRKVIYTYFNLRYTAPEFFSNRSLDADGIKHILNVIQICVLPKKTDQGYVVLCGRLIDTSPSNMYLEDAIKLLFMMVDLCCRLHHLPNGIIFVFDQSGVSLRHLTRVSLSTVKKYFTYIQEAIPVRLKRIHVINTSTVIAHIMTLIKPFMHKKHAEQLQLHSPEQFDEILTDIPLRILPKEYGGNAGPFDDLAVTTIEQMRSNHSWYKENEALQYDVSKDPAYDGIQGWFKKIF